MTKISPIAAYLTANKARTIKEGNIKRFVSPEGLYLGQQTKMERNGATAYIIELYSGFKKMFIQTTVIGQKLEYIVNKKSELGVSLVPTYTYTFKSLMDFFNNTIKIKQSARTLESNLKLIAADEKLGVGLYDIYGPFLYRERPEKETILPFKKDVIKYHFDKN